MFSSLPWAGNPYGGAARPTPQPAAGGKRAAHGAADAGGPRKRPKGGQGDRYSTCFTHFGKLPLDKKKDMQAQLV
jgi:hypothetical protein